MKVDVDEVIDGLKDKITEDISKIVDDYEDRLSASEDSYGGARLAINELYAGIAFALKQGVSLDVAEVLRAAVRSAAGNSTSDDSHALLVKCNVYVFGPEFAAEDDVDWCEWAAEVPR